MINRFHCPLVPMTLALSLTLTACGADNSQQYPAPIEQAKYPQNEHNKQGKQAAGQSTEQTHPTSNVADEIKNRLKMKKAILPSSFPVEPGYHVSVSIKENTPQSYKVIFYQTNKAMPIDDASLQPNEKVPVIASFSAKTYEDPNHVANLFAPFNVDNGPQTMDLGYGIKGSAEGGAGHSYLAWREGRWILQIDSLSQDQLDNQAIAKKMVAYLEEHALPAPKDKGRVKVTYRPGGNHVQVTIYWQNDRVIYELKTDQVPLNALQMAVSAN